MKVVVCAKKEIHLQDGPHVAGEIVELPDRIALRYLEKGAVERYETKVVRETPFAGPGEVQPSSALPVVQASAETTASGSEPGAKKRGRPKKVRGE